MDKLALYNYFRSSTSYRARIALEVKKLPFDYKPIHLLNNGGEQHSAEYHALNPMGGVPTLVHEMNGKKNVIGQSMAICEYLDEAFPQSYQLFPKDPYKKALVKQFCENINADTHAYGNLRTLQYLEKNFGATEEQKTKWIHYFITAGLTACEKMLEKHSGSFCFGDEITAADLFLVPQIFTSQRFKVPLEAFPYINKIVNHCSSIDAFKKAHPFRQVDTPEDLRIS
ncbi:MAG: maleylacetoacetate isomerase [Pseudobdellovibrio sp.]|nr:maleylacetoacetate isomerase [Pseudobdellovibrio sp.]